MVEDGDGRGAAIAEALPRVLREWASHHVRAFEEDDESHEHVIWTDFDGNSLSVLARRALHEEAHRRRGILAKSTDGRDGVRGVALVREQKRPRQATNSESDSELSSSSLELDEFTRWAELHGYVDFRNEPFDLYSELKISKGNANPAGRARAAYHKFALKTHPDGTMVSWGFCDSCSCVLVFGRWLRANVKGVRGQDFCETCVRTSRRVTGREYDRRRHRDQEPLVTDGAFTLINSLDDLGAERGSYESRSERVVTKAAFSCRRLQRLGIAFNVLKDVERCRIYTELGWDALVKSEKHSESDVFDLDGFSMYDSFFAGEDENDRQYLLLCPEAESDDDGDNDSAVADAEVESEIECLLESDKDQLERLPRKSSVFNAGDDVPKPSISVLMADPTLHTFRATEAEDEDYWTSFAARWDSAGAEDL